MDSLSFYTAEELREFGFSTVASDCQVSRLTRFHACTGRIGEGVRVDDYVVMTGSISLDTGVHISPFCFLNGTGGGISMGERSGIGAHSVVLTKSDDYSQVGMHREKMTGPVTIEANAILGTNVIVLPSVTIGEGASVGARCVIWTSVECRSRLTSGAIQVRVSAETGPIPSEPICLECCSWFAAALGCDCSDLVGGDQIDSLRYLEIVELAHSIDEDFGLKAREGLLGSTWTSILVASHDLGLCMKIGSAN